MKLKVLQYEGYGSTYHLCETEEGIVVRVDIMINQDGVIPKGINPKHLIGETFECDETFPYISIAVNVR